MDVYWHIVAEHTRVDETVPVLTHSARLRASMPCGVRKVRAVPRTLGGVPIMCLAV